MKSEIDTGDVMIKAMMVGICVGALLGGIKGFGVGGLGGAILGAVLGGIVGLLVSLLIGLGLAFIYEVVTDSYFQVGCAIVVAVVILFAVVTLLWGVGKH